MKTLQTIAEQALVRRRQMLMERVIDGAAAELHEIELALSRIASGHFGICERCAGAIGLQRLRAIPEARLCLSCNSLADHA